MEVVVAILVVVVLGLLYWSYTIHTRLEEVVHDNDELIKIVDKIVDILKKNR
jgi:hypothetical protein